MATWEALIPPREGFSVYQTSLYSSSPTFYPELVTESYASRAFFTQSCAVHLVAKPIPSLASYLKFRLNSDVVQW